MAEAEKTAQESRSDRSEEVEHSPEGYRTFAIFGSFGSKMADPGPLWLTDEAHWKVEAGVEDGLREDGIITGLCMKTGIAEELFSLEEIRDIGIRDTLEQPAEIGRIRGWVLSTLLRLYRLVMRGAEYPHRY